jgi:hypothetical protein
VKRLTLAVLILQCLAFGQVTMAPNTTVSANTSAGYTIASSCGGTDSFSGSGALSGCWASPVAGFAAVPSTITQASGVAVEAASFNGGVALYNGATASNDQYSQIIVSALPAGDQTGVCVRASTTGNGYCWGISSMGVATTCTAGVCSYAASCTSPTVGQTMKLDVQGTTITCYVNGSSVGSFSDSTYASGYPAIVINDGSSAGGASGGEISSFATGTP